MCTNARRSDRKCCVIRRGLFVVLPNKKESQKERYGKWKGQVEVRRLSGSAVSRGPFQKMRTTHEIVRRTCNSVS